MDLHEAKAALDEYSTALSALERMLNGNLFQSMLGEAILALGRPFVVKMDVLARDSAELAVLITKEITAQPHYLESRANEVLAVSAALQRLKFQTAKASEAAERFKKRDSMGEFTI